MRYNSIFFDLDGTLCDSYQGIENGIRQALASNGITDVAAKDIKKLIGIPLHDSLDKHFFNDTDKTKHAVKVFRTYYDGQGITESELYPGIMELLHRLAAVSDLFVITAKPTLAAKKILNHHKVAHYFTDIFGCVPDGGNFCKSELINSAYERRHSIIIGDKAQVIEAGKKSGIKTCGVLYGYGTEQEIMEAVPDFIIHTVPELNDII